VTVHEKGIKDSWKEYMEKLTNEENEWVTEYWLELKNDQQIISGSMKLLQHCKRRKEINPEACQG